MNVAIVLEALLALAIGLSVIFSIWRISGNVRAIREHLDFLVPAMRAYWKHQGISFSDRGVPAATKKEAEALAKPFGPDTDIPGSLGLRK